MSLRIPWFPSHHDLTKVKKASRGIPLNATREIRPFREVAKIPSKTRLVARKSDQRKSVAPLRRELANCRGPSWARESHYLSLELTRLVKAIGLTRRSVDWADAI
jgi:hypothetical protein